jgi:hypothetical protein
MTTDAMAEVPDLRRIDAVEGTPKTALPDACWLGPITHLASTLAPVFVPAAIDRRALDAIGSRVSTSVPVSAE